MGYRMRYLSDSMFSYFNKILACERWIHGRTDTWGQHILC